MDLTDASIMRSQKKKERHSNRGAATRMRNVFAKSPKSPKTTQKESSMKKKKQGKQNGQCNAITMKKSNKLRAFWKGCFVRRSRQTKKQRSSVHQHTKNCKTADHRMDALAASSSSKRAITRPPLTISISKTDPDTLLRIVSSSSLSSPPPLCLKDFSPTLQQQRNRVNFSEFIFSMPRRALDPSATLSLDGCGSNLLHLACFHGSNHDTMRYMFDNCRHDTQLRLLTNTDQDGNLPSHILVSSICRQKIDLDDGLKTLKVRDSLLYLEFLDPRFTFSLTMISNCK